MIDPNTVLRTVQDLVRREVAARLESVQYGAAFGQDSTTTWSVLLQGSSTPSPGFAVPAWMDVQTGDRLRVRIGPGGDRYVEENMSRGPVASGGAVAGEAFPVGSIYTSVVATNPGTTLGYGTWTAFGAGRVLVGLDAGEPLWDTVEETGGTKTVAAAGTNAAEAAHTHTGPSHTHGVGTLSGAAAGTGNTSAADANDIPSGALSGATHNLSRRGHIHTGPSHQHTMSGSTASDGTGASGAGASHGHAFTGSATSVIQPYIAVYFWKRTA